MGEALGEPVVDGFGACWRGARSFWCVCEVELISPPHGTIFSRAVARVVDCRGTNLWNVTTKRTRMPVVEVLVV